MLTQAYQRTLARIDQLRAAVFDNSLHPSVLEGVLLLGLDFQGTAAGKPYTPVVLFEERCSDSRTKQLPPFFYPEDGFVYNQDLKLCLYPNIRKVVVSWNNASTKGKYFPTNDLFFIGYRRKNCLVNTNSFYYQWVVFVSRCPDMRLLDQHYEQLLGFGGQLKKILSETYSLRQHLYKPRAVASLVEVNGLLMQGLFAPLFCLTAQSLPFKFFASMLGSILLQKSIAIVGPPQTATAILQVLKKSLQPIVIAGNFISFASEELAKNLFQAVTPVYFSTVRSSNYESFKTDVRIFDLDVIAQRVRLQFDNQFFSQFRQGQYRYRLIEAMEDPKFAENIRLLSLDYKFNSLRSKKGPSVQQEFADHLPISLEKRFRMQQEQRSKYQRLQVDLSKVEQFVNQLQQVWQQELLQPMRVGVSTVPDKPFWREFRGTQNYELTAQRVKEGFKM